MNVDMAERLAKRRRRAGLSQEALAERLGVSRQAVSKWERSESSPDTDILIALANLYGVSLYDLLYAEPADQADPLSDEAARDSNERDPQAESDAGSAADSAESAGFGWQHPNDPHEKVHIGPDGFFAQDGKDHVRINWRDGVHVVDGKRGDTVHVGWDGVRVNDRSFDSIHDLHEEFPHCRHNDIKPERLRRWRAWMRFPFPAVALLAYLIVGLAFGQWLEGLLLIFTIPLYYVIGTFVGTHSVGALVGGLYSVGALAWFCYMAFALNQPHPAWVALLTIPLACALTAWASHARKRKHHCAE